MSQQFVKLCISFEQSHSLLTTNIMKTWHNCIVTHLHSGAGLQQRMGRAETLVASSQAFQKHQAQLCHSLMLLKWTLHKYTFYEYREVFLTEAIHIVQKSKVNTFPFPYITAESTFLTNLGI